MKKNLSLLITPAIAFGSLSHANLTERYGSNTSVVSKYVEPVIPSEMVKAGESCEIIVRCVIDEEGNLVEAKTISTSNKHLESAVIEAVENWEFEAAKHKGQGRCSTINVPFRFTLASP